MSDAPAGSTSDSFADTIGIDLDLADVADGVVRSTTPIRRHLLQPLGIVHGGTYASIAETLASVGTWLSVHEDGMLAMGQANNTSFLRPATEGTIHAEARVRHQGRTSWVWDVDCTNDAGKLCATSRVTIAVRPAPAA
jgi:1,4-dihydroxy-2-naphthoyl-CoA hydrolase